MNQAIEVDSLTHRYGDRVALNGIAFQLNSSRLHVFLGPNGGGKTTLFRILSTLMPPQTGTVNVCGHSAITDFAAVRHCIGVVFQHPSIDKKLTVEENFQQQASLYGLRGNEYRRRRDEVAGYLGVADRMNDIVETLSGGLQRRVDLAKSILHRPQLLLLDEPTTGLDPGARSDTWRYLKSLMDDFGTTLVATSHLLEEADRANRVLILHEGQIVASGDPDELRGALGGDAISIETEDAGRLSEQLNQQWHCESQVVDREVRFAARPDGPTIDTLMAEHAGQIKSIKLGRPTLEDVFIAKTGHRFWQPEKSE